VLRDPTKKRPPILFYADRPALVLGEELSVGGRRGPIDKLLELAEAEVGIKLRGGGMAPALAAIAVWDWRRAEDVELLSARVAGYER
jgi:hypothetical protein